MCERNRGREECLTKKKSKTKRKLRRASVKEEGRRDKKTQRRERKKEALFRSMKVFFLRNERKTKTKILLFTKTARNTRVIQASGKYVIVEDRKCHMSGCD